MTNREAIKWLTNLQTSIGEPQYSSLWHYMQALSEIKDMLLLLPPTLKEIVQCKDCVHKYDPCPLYGGSQFFCAYGEREEE